jgi:hypothetical protein
MKIPTKVPEKGFYYHYKHDPSKAFNDAVYEVVGVGVHTEDDCRPEDENMVVYRPICETTVYKAGKLFDLRPLEMWMGYMTKDGKTFPRFEKITDPEIIAKLEVVKKQMYEE